MCTMYINNIYYDNTYTWILSRADRIKETDRIYADDVNTVKIKFWNADEICYSNRNIFSYENEFTVYRPSAVEYNERLKNNELLIHWRYMIDFLQFHSRRRKITQYPTYVEVSDFGVQFGRADGCATWTAFESRFRVRVRISTLGLAHQNYGRDPFLSHNFCPYMGRYDP